MKVLNSSSTIASGNRTAFVDENGNRTEYEYDLMNRLVKTIEPDPDGAGPLEAPVTSIEYDRNGNQSAVVDALGRRTEYRYDSRSRLIETIYPDGSREEARYDFDNNLISTIDANGNRSNNIYDARGRLIRRVDAKNNIQILQYNAANELIASTDENGYSQEFAYDDLGRQTAVTDSEGTTVTEYDLAGNATAQIDPLGNRTEFSYDALYRQTRVSDALTGETATKYDKAGNVLEVTDPEQNNTSFTYDNRNRLTSETNELGDSRSFDYDSVGNLIRKSDRNNRVTEWTYDALNRPQEENWLDSESNQVNSISFAYDSIGQLIAIEDSDSSYRFTYDEKGRQTSVDNTGTPGAPNVLLEYSYDNLDNLLSVSETINGKAAGITAYNYDELNRTSQITQTGAGVADKRVDFGYDGLGQFASIERYSDLSGSQLVGSSIYTYDGLNRLTNLNHSNGSGTFAFYDFEYDAASRITKIVDIDGTSDYIYDQTNQLTSASHTDPNKPNESYTYDENGNRTASHLHGSDYSTGLNNRLLTDGTYNYQYDAEGNMVLQIEIATGEEREFVWDHRNRLTAIVDKDSASDALQEVAFTYDAMNRRIAKEVNADPQNSSSGVVMYFVSDRDSVLLEFVDADGIDGQEEPTFHQRYLHGPAVDQMLAQENASGESLWNFTDQLGTGRDLTDNSGNVVNHLIYDSFGNVVSQTNNAFKSRYLFTGREFDEETGLHYYRARYYDGFIGRFLNPDPIGFDSGQTNLYAYVNNSPVNSIDPSGLLTFVIPGADGYGNLWWNLLLRARNGGVFPISKNPVAAAALATSLAKTFLGEGERIYIMAHSAGNVETVVPVISALRTLFSQRIGQNDANCQNPEIYFGSIYVGRLDPTFAPKFPFAIGANKVIDVGSNNPGSFDPRDIASLLWRFDFRAERGVGHNDLLNDTRVLDRLQREYGFDF